MVAKITKVLHFRLVGIWKVAHLESLGWAEPDRLSSDAHLLTMESNIQHVPIFENGLSEESWECLTGSYPPSQRYCYR